MSVFTRRLAASVGASLLTACAGLAFTATPASAATGADLTVTLSAGTIAVGSEGKEFMAKVKNVGDAKATGFTLTIELDLNGDVPLSVELPDELDDFCEYPGAGKAICEFGNVLVPNDSLEIPILVAPETDKTGNAGSLAVAVASPEDANESNNKVSTDITVSPPGVDIVVWAEDVVAGYDDETGEVQRIAPGSTGKIVFGIANAGDVTARGLELKLQLPEHVTFVEILEFCEASDDNRLMTCSGPAETLEPNRQYEFDLPVKIAADAPSPSDLTGSIEGGADGAAYPELARSMATTETAGWSQEGTESECDPKEVDEKDNADDFVVFVGAAPGGGGGLPVTGPKAVAIGALGLGVLAVGVLAFVGARRRRVILVTPAE